MHDVSVEVSVSSYFDRPEKDEFLAELTKHLAVTEIPKRPVGGFPMPVTTVIEFFWDPGTVFVVLEAVWKGGRLLLNRFRAKREANPDPQWSPMPAFSIKAINGERAVEGILSTLDNQQAEKALGILQDAMSRVFEEETEPHTWLYYNESTGEWEQRSADGRG